jgi:hypothetical protein
MGARVAISARAQIALNTGEKWRGKLSDKNIQYSIIGGDLNFTGQVNVD